MTADGAAVIGADETIASFTNTPGTVLVPSPSQPRPVGGSVIGSTPDIYVAKLGQATCDRGKLRAELNRSPNQATWLEQIGTDQSIDEYINSTTPVNLIWNTSVTIGYPASDGADSRQEPAVLKAGTAVLVDPRGVPVVRCLTGNPLGSPGDHPLPKAVTIEPAQAPLPSSFTLVASDGQSSIDRQAGTAGDKDKALADMTPSAQSQPTVSPSDDANPKFRSGR